MTRVGGSPTASVMIATIASTESSMANDEGGRIDMLMQAGLRLDKRNTNRRCPISLIVVRVGERDMHIPSMRTENWKY